ncbi:MAG: WXG100 family type VII secretion target [Clostridia bacterium]|nr:WXG100 family type VII secretion target [Clostridia bacterium]
MEGQIVVKTEVLEAQANTVEGLIKQVQNGFDEIKTHVGNTSSYWTGEAADAHRTKYSNEQPSIDEAIRRLQENVNDLRIMAGIYVAAEAQATQEAENLISEVIG